MMHREDDFKVNRQQLVTHIRKSNRQQIFLKRRHLQHQLASNLTQNSSKASNLQTMVQKKYQLSQIDQLCSALNHEQIEYRLQAARLLKNIVGEQQIESYSQRIVDNNVIPWLITFMLKDSCLQLRLESCQILTHLIYASSSHCESIIQKQGIDTFMTLLYENNPPLILQALWALGNIAGDCYKCRDKVILKGGVDCVIRIISNYPTPDVAKIGIWVLSNLSRGDPLPSYDLIKQTIPLFGSVIVRGLVEGNYLECALWSLNTHSQGSKSKIRRILQVQNLIAKTIELCYSNKDQIVVPALRLLGNVSTGSKSQTDELLNNHCLALLKKLINHKKRSIRRQSCWILSNICAGTMPQVQKCIFYPDLMPKLAQMLLTDEHDVRKQICYVFGNICHLGDPNEIYQVITENQILQGLYILIQQDDEVATIEIALHCLYELLSIGVKINEKNPVLCHIQRIPGFVDRLQSLQHHLSTSIYQRLSKILQRFFILQEQQF